MLYKKAIFVYICFVRKQITLKELFDRFNSLVSNLPDYPQRKVLEHVNRNAQMNIILGLRGIGKTTFLLQEAQKRLAEKKSTLYISLDEYYFLENRAIDVIEEFHASGGEFLFIDEVHYDPHPGRLLKITFDRYPRLKVWATGSSALQIYQGKADLSRRAHYYEMPGLSFREYARNHYSNKILDQTLSIPELINEGIEIANEVGKLQGIRKVFHDYLNHGYFPFNLNPEVQKEQQIQQLIEAVLNIDMKLVDGYDTRDARQTLKFFRHMVTSAPYDLNISKTASALGFTRNKVINYLFYLEQAGLMESLNVASAKKGSYSKPDKIFLSNPNFYYAMNMAGFNEGAQRESFALNQLLTQTKDISLHEKADFLIDEKYVFEIGGKSKNEKQIAGLEHGYIFADNLEVAYGKRLPLWLLGFLY